MADKRLLGNVALPEYSRLVYNLDSEGAGVKILNKDDHRIFSVRIDSETIKINSEGNLYLPLDGQTVYFDESEGLIKATGLTVSEGDAIKIDEVIINGVPQETINVMFDSETIVLDSEGRLTVPIDRQTIVVNDLGQLVAIPEPLKDGVATHVHFGTSEWDSEAIDVLYDSETLRVDSENRLYVPIDKELVVVNSEGLISLAIDNKTIIFENSEIKTRIGGWREDPVDTTFFTVNEPAPTEVITVVPTSIPEIGDQVTVEVTMDVAGLPQTETKTFTLVGNGDYLEGLDASGTLVDGVRFKKDHSEAELILDATRVASGSNLVAVVHGETYVYHKVIGKYIPTDDETIFINDDLDLQVIYRVDEERGLEIDSENRIAVKVDGETIGFDSEGRLTGTKKIEAINPVYITSEGDSEGEQKIKLLYADALDVNSEGQLFTKVDNLTIKLNSEGELATALEAGIANEIITSEGAPVINVLFDDVTIHLNSENELELHPDEERAFSVDSEGKLFVKVDGLTIQYNSEGELVSFPEPLHDGVATHVVYGTSEWDSEAINVLFNSEAGLMVNSENELEVKVDGDTVRFNSEGELEAKTILEGEANHIYDSEGNLKIDVLYDDVTIHLNSENELELHLDSERGINVDSEGKIFIKVDDLSIKYDSEGRLYAIPEPLFNGVATRVNPKTSAYDSESIDVLFNSEAGLFVNSENELEVKIVEPLHFNSEGQIELKIDDTLVVTSEGELRADIDEETLVLNSEGKIIVNIDNETIVYEDSIVVDSEGSEGRDGVFKLRVPIDNETIRLNSEGKLEADALPKPYVADTFLHIDSETMSPEWREAKINSVSLVGDHNTEEAKITWWGTSEEYAALEAAGQLNEYTLYIINDNSPIVPDVKDYEELINKPEINGVQLSGNKSLASFGIQPALTAGTAISLANNRLDVSYLAGVLGVDTSNRLFADTYTTEQIDNMLASLRTVRYSATKPTNPSRNTLYYVGTSSPYQIYLYDSYGTEIDLGTSAVQTYSAGQGILINTSNVISADLTGVINEGETSSKAPTAAAVAAYAEHKTNKVTTLAATSTNDQYPSAKLVYDELNEKVGAIAPDDNSLEILNGTTLRHTEPVDLGPAGVVGGATSIPQITYDKFGHIQKAEGISVYPPTTAGLSGQLWVSDGVEAGTWSSLSNLMRVKYQTGSTTTSGTGSIVINGPAADAGYKRLCCVGAYITNNIAGLSWTVTAINDAQVTFFVSNITGTQTINATTVWLYVREATV